MIIRKYRGRGASITSRGEGKKGGGFRPCGGNGGHWQIRTGGGYGVVDKVENEEIVGVENCAGVASAYFGKMRRGKEEHCGGGETSQKQIFGDFRVAGP